MHALYFWCVSATDVIQARIQKRCLPSPQECRRLRIAAGLTRRDIADAIGASVPAVGHWENGLRRPRGEFAERYAEVIAAIRRALDDISERA